MRICAACPEPIVGRNERALYCSEACSQRAHKERRAVAASAARGTPERLTDLYPGLQPAQRRVLQALIAAGGRGATTRELCQPDVGGVRFGGRIFELRGMGFRIEAKCERRGSTRYWLRDSPLSRRLFDVTSPEAARAA